MTTASGSTDGRVARPVRITAVILAGGEGRRMGGVDKALLPLAGRPLLAHVLDRIATQVDGIVLSANGDPARFAAFGLPVLADERPMGPLSGILAGLRHGAAEAAEMILSLPCDTPFVPADLVARLVAGSDGGTRPAFASADGRDHNATALWPVALAAALAAFLSSGARPRIADFAALHGATGVPFPDPAAFDNLNTPAELAAAEARVEGRQFGGRE